jgi:sarcosine oxidase, subunit beta
LAANYDLVVVGAGIFGASCAYHAKRLGIPRVLLIEKGAGPGCGTTGASAAIIRQHYSNKVLSEATRESIGIFRMLERELATPDELFRNVGWYFLVPPDGLQAARDNIDMQKRIGIETSMMTIAEAPDTFPWINPEGVAAVVHEPGAGYADPIRCAEAFVRRFEALGGLTKFNTRCDAILRNGDRVEGVATSGGRFSAEWVVNAAGPWSMALAATAQIPLPIKIFREQETIWQCRYSAEMPGSSISNAVDAVYLRPMGQGRYTIGRGYPKEYTEADADNFDRHADDDVVNDIQQRVQHRFPPFARATYLNGFSSLYDVTPDWYPFLGPRGDVAGYADASGGSGHGFKLAPALGSRLASWISEGRAAPEIKQLSYDRVISGKMFTQRFGGNRG